MTRGGCALSVVLTIVVGGCAAAASPSPPPTLPSPSATPDSPMPTATEPATAATLTLANSACAYDGPAAIPPGRLSLDLVNETGDQFDVDLWLLDDGHDYEELAAHIEEEMRRSDAGEPPLGHPAFARLVAEATVTEPTGRLVATVAEGIHGFACIRFAVGGGSEEWAGIWAAGPFSVEP